MKRIQNKLTVLIGIIISFAVFGATMASLSNDVSAKTIQINSADYGYGKYKVTARGTGYNGVYDEDSVVFYYLPVYASIEEDKNGDSSLKLDYEAEKSGEEGEGGEGEEGGEGGSEEDDGVKKVAKIEVKIYDENGNEVPGLSPITVLPPTKEVPLTKYFDDMDLPSGTYKIEVIAYDKDNEALYKPYIIYFEYERIDVPDTGSFFQTLNISKTDYLVTALIAFATVTIPGIFIVARKNGKTNKKSRKH